MKNWPLLGPFVGQGNPIWIDRNSRHKSKAVADEMIETLRHKINLLVYPEGTSTDGEHGILPFKSTPFEAAVDAGCHIQPLLTFFSCEDAAGCSLAWYGESTLLPHIWKVLGLRQAKADVYILPVIEPIAGETRKELAARVYELMSAEYKRIREHAQSRQPHPYLRSLSLAYIIKGASGGQGASPLHPDRQGAGAGYLDPHQMLRIWCSD